MTHGSQLKGALIVTRYRCPRLPAPLRPAPARRLRADAERPSAGSRKPLPALRPTADVPPHHLRPEGEPMTDPDPFDLARRIAELELRLEDVAALVAHLTRQEDA